MNFFLLFKIYSCDVFVTVDLKETVSYFKGSSKKALRPLISHNEGLQVGFLINVFRESNCR
jgi:hypothetical protein